MRRGKLSGLRVGLVVGVGMIAGLGGLARGGDGGGEGGGGSGPGGGKPNIILFMVDDMGWQDTSVAFHRDGEGKPLRSFLNERYKTPNMERLAAQGMMFDNAYATPICSPTRVSLMTGMNAARHRVTNWTLKRDQSTDTASREVRMPAWNVNGLQPEGTRASGRTLRPISGEEIEYRMEKPYVTGTTLPQLLKQEGGYTTIHCGKAHFGTRGTPGANPRNLGFDYNIAGSEIGGPGDYRGARKYGSGDFAVRGLDENNYYADDIFLTEALTREAIQRLEAIRRDPGQRGKPFYLYMAHYAVHAPFDQRGYDKRFAEGYADPKDGHPWSDNEKRYAGLVEGMDKSLGDLMDYLEKTGLSKNTVIVFMSDNGGLAVSGRMGPKETNYPLSYGKGSAREGGIREPMLVSWPGVTKPGSLSRQVVRIEDFFPTLLEIGGVKAYRTEQKVDGESFVGQLREPGKVVERDVLTHIPNVWGEGAAAGAGYGPFSSLRRGDWKLIYWHVPQRFELFNLKEDIGEGNNLLASERGRAVQLAAELGRQLRARGAQMPEWKEGNTVGQNPGTRVPWPDEVLK